MATRLRPKPAPAKPEAKTPRTEVKAPRPLLPKRDIGVVRLVRDIRSELRKVVWPTRQEAINLTIIVIAVSAAVGMLLGSVDYIFRRIFELLVAGF
ncbi:MAG: preprotein translocase subunit SecE [Chloroflexi bacterium]|nr:preprotein translocase subunit SecE [Chloroflexota bacterium]